MELTVAQIVLDKATTQYDKPYSYLVPDSCLEQCKVGCRVVVPFGKGNTERQGLVIKIGNMPDSDIKLKSILYVADASPILNDEMLKLCEWLHNTLFCTYFDAVNTVLPTGVTLRPVTRYALPQTDFSGTLTETEQNICSYLAALKSGESTVKLCKLFGVDSAFLNKLAKKGAVVGLTSYTRHTSDAMQKTLRATVAFEDLDSFKLTPRQKEIAELVCQMGEISIKEIQYFTGASAAVSQSLVKKGVAECYNKEIYRLPKFKTSVADSEKIALTDEQQAAYNTLNGKLETGGTALLYGVTGSGKTKVFLKLCDSAVKANKGVIVMVPEISLTPQTISIFNNRYNGKVAVFHSAMSLGQRMDEWKRVKNGHAQIAIGTRSAIFAPFENLGLIIMDEEQERTYKSEQSPRFHARDVSRFRAAYHNALFVMASATPSLETYTAANSGKYIKCTLKSRYGNAVLPTVETVDMRAEMQKGNAGNLSGVLCEAIGDALKNKKQAIVLLNRRGHDTFVSCPNCGYVAECDKCSVSLTYHSANHRLMCHYCGNSMPVFKACPKCGNTFLKFSGAGTQKVAEELSLIFKDARVLRMDADSTATRDSYYNYLTDFAAGKYDVLLGTQMVAKGLDFKNVTVVGVLNADKASAAADFKSTERTFSLLTQVVGRAGRGDAAGRAIIQTLDPESSVISLASTQNYDAFYNEEIALRKLLIYPPFCDIVSICVRAYSQAAALQNAQTVLNNIAALGTNEYKDVPVIVLGPTVAQMPKVNNKYRVNLLIKCKNNAKLREMINKAISFKYPNGVSLTVDINSETLN